MYLSSARFRANPSKIYENKKTWRGWEHARKTPAVTERRRTDERADWPIPTYKSTNTANGEIPKIAGDASLFSVERIAAHPRSAGRVSAPHYQNHWSSFSMSDAYID